MSDKTHEEFEQELEDEEQAYLDAFQEESEKLSAETTGTEASVAEELEESPDEEDHETGGHESPKTDGTASQKASKENDDPYAWISQLPENLQEQAKALQHSAVSNAGRVSALQRRVNEVQARLQAKEAAQSSGRGSSSSKAPAKKEEKALSPTLQEFVEQYPQLAQSVREMVSSERAELEAMMQEQLAPIREETTYRQVAAARERLEEGAAKIFDTANTNIHYTDVLNSELYKDVFLSSQPEEFQRIAKTTNDPDTALWVLQQFHNFAENYARENGLTEEPKSGKSVADRTSERRRTRAAASRTTPSRSAVVDPDDTGDYEALFRRMNS